MASPVLPDDLGALKSFLQDAVRRFDTALNIATSVAANRERYAALREFEPKLALQAKRLHDLAAPEAEEALALLAAAQEERARLESPEVVGPRVRIEDVDGPCDVQSPHAVVAESPCPDGKSALRPSDSHELVEPDPPARAHRTERELLFAANALFEEADHLLKAAPVMIASSSTYGLRELECHVRVLVGKARGLQEEEPSLYDSISLAGQKLHYTFGCLTRICKEFLATRNVFVRGLQRDHEEHWEEYQRQWERERQRITAAACEERELSQNREMQERRRHQIEDQNREIHQGLLVELEDHLAEQVQDGLWIHDFRALVDECLHFGKPSDSRLLELVKSQAGFFERGDEYRALRKHLRAKCGVEFGSNGLEDQVSGPVPLVELEVRRSPSEIEHLRGAFAGKRAALVGGSSREERRRAIQAFFGFSQVDWIEHERTETADGANLARRIENGRYDIVFFLARFSSHPLQSHVKQACKAANVPFALVERGYGVAGLARAWETSSPARAELPLRAGIAS